VVSNESEIRKNKYFFDCLEQIFIQETNPAEKAKLAKIAFFFAVFNHPGIFSSQSIESELIKLSPAIKPELKSSFKPFSSLHVFTQCYLRGGHTRIANNWINFSPEAEKHSVILLEQENMEVPHWLKESVNRRNGDFFILDNTTDLIDKALKLREIALEYEYIILHVHMFDVISILAFGSEELKNRVILSNHAGHTFWSGISVSDCILNYDKGGLEHNIARRGTVNDALLPLPITLNEFPAVPLTKKALNLPENKKIILSIGESYKFKKSENSGNYDFIETIMKIIKRVPDSVVILMGPHPSEPFWQDIFEKSKGQIRAIGPINDPDIFKSYIYHTDLFIHSFPFESPTSFYDVLLLDSSKVITLKPITIEWVGLNNPDIFNLITCETTDELIERAVALLAGDCTEYLENIEKFREEVIRNSCNSGWYDALKRILAKVPPHKVNTHFESEFLAEEYDQQVYKSMSHQKTFIQKRAIAELSVENQDKIMRAIEKYNDFNNSLNEIYNEGLLSLEKDKYSLSESIFNKLCQYNSSNYNYFYYLALAQYKQNKFEEAVESFSTALELGAYSFEVFNLLALSLEKTGETEMAELFHEKARDLNN
jgi:hypothetical protein